jgi:guanylate kinase
MQDPCQDILERISTKLITYQPSDKTIQLVRDTPIVLLVGISGAGKDTIKHKLLESGNYHHIVSHTTRAPRENGGVLELDGVDYHFVSLETAEKLLNNGGFVESKMYSGNVYGTSAAEIQTAHDEERIAITDVEVQGVAEYKEITSNVIAIFILPPDYAAWQERLRSRYGDKKSDPADIEKRMHTAVRELEEALKVPYYHFVMNDDLGVAVDTVDNIAHNQDIFNRKDTEVRQQAEQLLDILRSKVK